MSRPQTDQPVSPYYPPRARWYRRLFSPWYSFQRARHLEKIHLPGGITPLQVLACFVVPGFSFVTLGKRIQGFGFLAGYCIAWLLFLTALGYQPASMAYGTIISTHAISIFFLLIHQRDLSFATKFMIGLFIVMFVWLLVYRPLIGYAERHWFTPLRIGENVVIISTTRPDTLRLGDWVATRVSPDAVKRARAADEMNPQPAVVHIEKGFSLGPLLAIGGDRVEFGVEGTNRIMRINGAARPALPHMPVSGSVVIPENHWFVWPNLAIGGNAEAAEKVLLQLAVVSGDEIVGRPYTRWFWRHQTPRSP